MTVHEETEIRALVAAHGSGWLVTASNDTPDATLTPIIWHGTRVIAHIAKANPHWHNIDDETPGLFIVGGPQVYISPSWYPSKAEHGRVVPTWNYIAIHLSGPIRVHHDPDWLRSAVTDLTDFHERHHAEPWRVTDAPIDFIDAQLRAIVGIEMTVERVDAKAKLSQNRSEADQRGVINGLARSTETDAPAITTAMHRHLSLDD